MDVSRDANFRRGLALILLGIAMELGGVVYELDYIWRVAEGSSLPPPIVAYVMMIGGLLLALYGTLELGFPPRR